MLHLNSRAKWYGLMHTRAASSASLSSLSRFCWMYSVTRRSLHEGSVPMAPGTGPTNPELGTSTVAADMSSAEPALAVWVIVIAISLRLKIAVMIGLDLQSD